MSFEDKYETVSHYEKTEGWLNWILKSKFSKYLCWLGISLLLILVSIALMYTTINDYYTAYKLMKTCTQETKGTVVEISRHHRRKNVKAITENGKVIAEYKVNDQTYKATGRRGFRSYSRGEYLTVHFNPDDNSISYAGEYPYCGPIRFYFFVGLIFVVISIYLPFGAKIGREKITITDASGMKLTVAAGNKPNLLSLTGEDGSQLLVTKEHVLGIINDGGKFVSNEGWGLGSKLNGSLGD